MIRVPKVKLVDENGTMVGEVDTAVARTMARERGFDLVEVAPDARPPVCKLLDYGKFKYEEKKKKKVTHQKELKEVRLRPRTDAHDLQTKLNHARGFLEEGHKVLFTVFFRGREQAHKEFGRAMMEKISRELDDISKVEHEISQMGPRMHMTLMPKGGAPVKKADKHAAPKPPAPPAVPGAPAPAAPPPPATPTPPPPTTPPTEQKG
jgi:translation initiation factor IF-3